VRVKPPGKTRWVAGHAVWIHDVLGDDKVVATPSAAGGGAIEVAARAEHRDALLGPYADRDAGQGEHEVADSGSALVPA
jgi:hypothetical protein